ncbi:telomerase protein component 1-like [Patiria miniata]|uniref:Telomerase protein component 1 n=1 Tax=Patiria miniata TaxID=46514 RepID=A0A914BS88_PATMI|nr:telomerase protein component 1-like [Patiria miniata]XP_038078831.1 telomerase protein component 1-like [Patiria miniata]
MGIVCGKKKKEVDPTCSLSAVRPLVKDQENPSTASAGMDKTEETPPAKKEVEKKVDESLDKDDEPITESQTTPGPALSHGAQLSKPQPVDEGDVNMQVVAQCWREIDRQCEEHVGKNYPSSGPNFSGWRAVRLFVSSTFQDFHNEREILVKKVFPELREWCESLHLHLLECDLRWGVPKDATTRTVLTTCMEEIDRCHGDADGQGFFLNMLGERYGWVPAKDNIPNDIAEEYQWVPLISVTHMEILLGAYRCRNPNAAFFLRDQSGFSEMIPEENKNQFVEPTELGKIQLKKLKAKLQQRFPEQTFPYSCEFDTAQDSKVRLKGLDDFGRQVLEFFKKAIERKFPPSDNVAPTPDKLEQDQHDIYMEQKGKLVFGRDSEIGKMTDFAKGLHKDAEGEAGKQRHHMMVVADPGEGKSSLMARFVMEVKKAGLTVFYHFVGCTAESNRPSSILKRLVGKLEELYPDTCVYAPETDGETSEGKKTEDELNALKMAAYVKKLGETGTQFLIVVDAVNQTSQENNRYCWLPAALAGNLRCVMSTTREAHTAEELGKHCSPAELTLEALDDKAREEIVTNYFKRYNKTLDPEQLVLLTHSEGARNALWLSLSCEELRVYGVFEKLTDRIRELPASLEGLIEIILARLISEDETGMVEKMLHYLQCVPGGLNETELQALLGDIEGDKCTPAPALHWAVVRRTLKPFLRNSGAYGQVERLQFFHLALNKAVQKRLMENDDLRRLRHRQLADYYQYHCHDLMAVTNQLARQLAQAKEGQRLVNFFRTDKRSTSVNKIEKSRLLKEFRCTNMTKSDFPGCTKFGFCSFCKNARSKLDPNSYFQNKDCCAICGDRVPFPGPKSAKAYWCPFHKPSFPSFGAKYNCYVCQKSINQPGEPPLAYICQFCDPGHMERCCKLAP